MKKDIVIVDTPNQILKVTTIDERWYSKQEKDEGGLPMFKFYPSVTWIASYYYTSPYLVNWIADKGLTESDRIKKEAGLKGSKVHQATESLDRGETIEINSKFLNPDNGQQEELTVDEYEAILSYANWFKLVKPDILATEMTVFNEEYEYAGTLDRIVRIAQQIFILDIKTSKNVWDEHWLQTSAYLHADIDYKKLNITDEEWNNRGIYILQLGYKMNKAGYKVNEMLSEAIANEQLFQLFLNAMLVFKRNNPNNKPKQRDLPLKIKLETDKEEQRVVTKKIVKKEV